MNTLTHLDEEGRALMVDVGDKSISERVAIASAQIKMKPETIIAIWDGKIPKGDAIACARIAGIMAAKKTVDLIPLCHTIRITAVRVEFNKLNESTIEVRGEVKAKDKTGVEMEALTAVSVACLTIYDMCKAIDKEMEINAIHLETKTGGKSDYRREAGAE